MISMVLLLDAALSTAPCTSPDVNGHANDLFGVWLPVGLSFLQFVGLAYLTYHIFASGARQKVAEREAKWYHKIVVDYCIDLMATFFDATRSALCDCAIELPKLEAAEKHGEFDTLIRRTLADFKRKLHTMSTDASRRISFFDAEAEKGFLERVDRLEDEIAAWFDSYINGQPFDQRASLPRALSACQNELLEIIKSYEFSEWGWPLRKVRSKGKLR